MAAFRSRRSLHVRISFCFGCAEAEPYRGACSLPAAVWRNTAILHRFRREGRSRLRPPKRYVWRTYRLDCRALAIRLQRGPVSSVALLPGTTRAAVREMGWAVDNP